MAPYQGDAPPAPLHVLEEVVDRLVAASWSLLEEPGDYEQDHEVEGVDYEEA